ncbi:hypothetical protein ES707_11917 [subsurface metagenome]
MESQDKEKEYEHNIWEIYRKEFATANREKRLQLNKRMHRWQELMKSGWTASLAYYKVMKERQETPPIYPFWTKMRKTFVVIPVLALAAAIVYGIVITGEINPLKTELESVQSVLTSTQAELSSTEQALTTTQAELSSTEQTLTSTQAELSSTQAELSSTEQRLFSIQSELSSTKQALTSTQSELETTKAELEATEAELELYKETLGIEVFSDKQPLYEKAGLSSREINLINNQIATNPTWQELIAFLRSDPTDDETYWKPVFNCANFAEMLHNNAETTGIKAAFVGVFFSDEEEGHALNAFKTTDRGLVYVDCTGPTLTQQLQQPYLEWDKIAYVLKGKAYGSVSISLTVYPEYSYYEQIGKSSGSGWLPLGIVESIEIYW